MVNRIIKFRGKRIDNGEWIYGDLIQNKDIATAIIPQNPGYKNYYDFQVDPDTVGQYTGLKDKNGVEIYELMEIDNLWRIVYNFNRYVLQSISNSDIFAEILKDKEYEITREYSEMA